MKTIFKISGYFIFAVLALCTAELVAQPNWTVGPKLGMTQTKFTGVNNAEGRSDISAGVFALYSSWSHFGISGDLMYTGRRGAYMLNTGEQVWVQRKTLLQYIEMPILANVFFLERGSRLRPKVMLGPSFSYLVAGREAGSGPESDFNHFDMGVVGGIGANFRLTQMTWLNFDARYNKNFFDVGARTSTAANVTTHGLNISLGLGFGL